MQSNILSWLDYSANKYSDKIAIKDENDSITYRGYREKSLSIARSIIEIKEKNDLESKESVNNFV